MKKYLPFAIAFYCSNLFAQPWMSWQHCTGGTDSEQAAFVAQTHDQGFIVAGASYSTNGDVVNNHGGEDALIVRLDSNNNILWQKTYGGTSDDDAVCILETNDHGFMILARTESNDGDVSLNHGNDDVWVVKIDSLGSVQWEKTFGDSTDDWGFSIIENSSGNFVILGSLGDLNWDMDFWLFCIDQSGNMVWQNTYGGSDDDDGYQVIQTSDGGYMLAGGTYSMDGDITFTHGERDVWLIKTDGGGNMQWQKTYGGSVDDITANILELPNGGYFFAAVAESNDGDITGSPFGFDEWIVKTDASGNIISQKSFGGSEWDEPYRVLKTPDNGFVIAGMTESNDGDVIGNHGDMDCWTLKLDSALNKQWALCSGGTGEDLAYGICQLSAGDYVITGYTFSNDGNVSGNHGGGNEDIWTFRLSDSTSSIPVYEPKDIMSFYPNPASEELIVEFVSKTGGEGEVSITDLSGRKIMNEIINASSGKNRQAIHLMSLDAGIYLLALRFNDELISKQLIKE